MSQSKSVASSLIPSNLTAEVDDSNEENSLVTALGEFSFCTRPPPMSSRSAFCIEVIITPSIALSGNNPGYLPWSRANISHALAKDCIRLFVFVFFADSWTPPRAERRIPAKIAMIAITTRISTRVKPYRDVSVDCCL